MTKARRLGLHAVTVLLTIYSCFAFASYSHLPSYYPQELINQLNENTARNHQLKKILHNVTAQAHIKKSSGRDVIARYCPSNETCEIQITTRSYREAREILFGEIHLEKVRGEYIVRDLYCEQVIDESQGVGPGRIPNPKFMNCEHTWPQSRFNPNEDTNAQLTDLHHLFPVNSRANSSRGNNIFAEVDGDVVNSECTSSYRGRAIGSSEIAFEPPAEHKGDVARALFYFSIRYNHPIGPLEEEFLKNWHQEDPVDEFERERHEKVYQHQKNRNPFIDAPQLVELVSDF